MRSLLVLATVTLSAAATPVAAQGSMTLYCSIQEEQCRAGAVAFEKATGTKVLMVRKSTGEAFAQIKAEGANPKGDVWWGGPGDPHLQAAEEGLLETYKSPNLAGGHPWAQRLAEQSQFRTSGIYLGALGFGINAEVLKKKGIAEPKCWADLIDPKLRDEVQVADPNSSGTAYVKVASLVQLMGEDKAFAYMKALHLNINQYTKSGTAPVKALSIGETAVGIVFLHDVVTQIVAGAPLKIVVPCEGTGYETGAISLIKGARNIEAAKQFIDWALTADAQKAMFTDLKIYSIPGATAAIPHESAPKLADMKLITYDNAKYGSSAERTRLLRRWDTEIKSAAK